MLVSISLFSSVLAGDSQSESLARVVASALADCSSVAMPLATRIPGILKKFPTAPSNFACASTSDDDDDDIVVTAMVTASLLGFRAFVQPQQGPGLHHNPGIGASCSGQRNLRPGGKGACLASGPRRRRAARGARGRDAVRGLQVRDGVLPRGHRLDPGAEAFRHEADLSRLVSRGSHLNSA